MLRIVVVKASLAVALTFTASLAVGAERRDGSGPAARRVEKIQREGGDGHRPVHLHYRFRFGPTGYRGRWYGTRHADVRRAVPRHARRPVLAHAVPAGGFVTPASHAFVSYPTYVYFTPGHPGLTSVYPPYFRVYGLISQPIYSKPCLC